MLGEIAAAQLAGKTVGGHYASPDLGLPFHAYVAGGPADDHEGTRVEDAIARVRQGMRAMLRLGSAWYDVATQIKAITERGLDSRIFILCTDDCHSGTLVDEGHMDRVVRHAIAQGLRPITAIQMATLNTAQHFGMERELGSITPGRRADVVISSDLATLPIETVIARGVVLAEGRPADGGHPALCLSRCGEGHGAARATPRRRRLRRADQHRKRARSGCASSASIENQAPTRALEATLPVKDGVVEIEGATDVCHIALVERHQGHGRGRQRLRVGLRLPAARAPLPARSPMTAIR